MLIIKKCVSPFHFSVPNKFMGNQDGASYAFYSMLVMLIAFSFNGLDRCFCKQLMMCNKNFVIVALNKTDGLANYNAFGKSI